MPRPKWQIDAMLEGSIGQDVRIAVASFTPPAWSEDRAKVAIRAQTLYLPDNTRADGLPLLVEGRLQHFVRRIAVVEVALGAPRLSECTADGLVYFRGRQAVIIRGPLTAELAYPFLVERLPSDPDNYWSDIKKMNVQLALPLPTLSAPC